MDSQSGGESEEQELSLGEKEALAASVSPIQPFLIESRLPSLPVSSNCHPSPPRQQGSKGPLQSKKSLPPGYVVPLTVAIHALPHLPKPKHRSIAAN